MTDTVRETRAMIAGMDPALDEQAWCFVSADDPATAIELMRSALATFREDEGLSLIIPAEVAEEAEIKAPEFARITLQVHSDLAGYGLTAAVATALAEAQIACNMVAALRHDHAFVPVERAEDAMTILHRLSESAA